jgi:signal transduction histidine kinase
MFLGIEYFFLIQDIQINFIFFVIFLLSFIVLSGIFIAKLAIDPLSSYVDNLQNLSKETLHELNLPLSTIQTNLGMLQKNLSDIKTLKRLGRIESACQMLQQRYDELDYMIKMQTHQELKEHCDLQELIEQRIVFLQRIYTTTTFVLHLEHKELFIDTIGLIKVIDNIIDNGVKYSQDLKKIVIRIQNDTLYIQDFGIGMDELELLHIFDTYYQVNKEVQGFGIGLSMVKRYCDTNAIGLRFDSQEGVGTTVSLQFK